MKNVILCAIDLSDNSRNVLKFAIDLSRQNKIHITILYAYRLLNGESLEPIEARRKLEESARQKFSELEKELLQNSGVQYDFKLEVGFVANRIREFIKTNKVSFLVIAKNTSSGIKEPIDEIAGNLHIPLVIVP